MQAPENFRYKPSARSQKANAFLVMDMLRNAKALADAGENIVHMEAGQPFGPPPRKVVEAAQSALASDKLGYTQSCGLPELRERIARHYKESYQVDVDPARIIVTTGSSGGFILAFLAAFDAGARVGLTSPGYPAYRNIFRSLEIDVTDIPVHAENRWAPCPETIAKLGRSGEIDGLLLASPANPTGTMVTPETLATLSKTCADNNLWFISDEIYHRLNYTVPNATALTSNDKAIVINSFSKYYCMTGWRIGWMIVPDELVRPCEILAQNMFISAPTLSQIASIAAFDATEELEQRKADYAANRELLLNDLPSVGLDRIAPADGAFYLYADVSKYTNDSLAFATKMLNEIGVGMTPGVDFDAENGHKFLRMSFAGAKSDMEEAVKRLKGWL